jgi:mannose PTS system EIIBCA component
MTIGEASTVFDTSLFIPELRYRKPEPVLGEMIARASRAGAVTAGRFLRTSLALRERLGPTAIGKGVAVPHARSIAVLEPRLVLGRSRQGIEWSAPDDEVVRLVLLVLSPAGASAEVHVDWVARAVGAVRTVRQRQRLLDAESFDEVATLLREVIA